MRSIVAAEARQTADKGSIGRRSGNPIGAYIPFSAIKARNGPIIDIASLTFDSNRAYSELCCGNSAIKSGRMWVSIFVVA